jgi:hypothetical protein
MPSGAILFTPGSAERVTLRLAGVIQIIKGKGIRL